jgi:lipoate-protein ligase A
LKKSEDWIYSQTPQFTFSTENFVEIDSAPVTDVSLTPSSTCYHELTNRQTEEDADAEFKWSFTAKHARETLEDAHAEFKMSFTAKHGRITDLSISFPGSLRSFEIEAITSSLLNKKIHEIKDWKDALFLSLQEEETNPETYLERQLLPFHVGESMNDLFLVPKTYSGKGEDV